MLHLSSPSCDEWPLAASAVKHQDVALVRNGDYPGGRALIILCMITVQAAKSPL